jgi:hypothetical protein
MWVACWKSTGILQPSLCSIEQSLRLAFHSAESVAAALLFGSDVGPQRGRPGRVLLRAMTGRPPRSISPEASHLPEPVGTNRLPSVGLVAFGQRLHLRQRRLPVAMPGRNNKGTLVTCPAENTPRQAGEPHDVVTVPRALDIPGALHQSIEGCLSSRVGRVRPIGDPGLVGRYGLQPVSGPGLATCDTSPVFAGGNRVSRQRGGGVTQRAACQREIR